MAVSNLVIGQWYERRDGVIGQCINWESMLKSTYPFAIKWNDENVVRNYTADGKYNKNHDDAWDVVGCVNLDKWEDSPNHGPGEYWRKWKNNAAMRVNIEDLDAEKCKTGYKFKYIGPCPKSHHAENELYCIKALIEGDKHPDCNGKVYQIVKKYINTDVVVNYDSLANELRVALDPKTIVNFECFPTLLKKQLKKVRALAFENKRIQDAINPRNLPLGEVVERLKKNHDNYEVFVKDLSAWFNDPKHEFKTVECGLYTMLRRLCDMRTINNQRGEIISKIRSLFDIREHDTYQALCEFSRKYNTERDVWIQRANDQDIACKQYEVFVQDIRDILATGTRIYRTTSPNLLALLNLIFESDNYNSIADTIKRCANGHLNVVQHESLNEAYKLVRDLSIFRAGVIEAAKGNMLANVINLNQQDHALIVALYNMIVAAKGNV